MKARIGNRRVEIGSREQRRVGMTDTDARALMRLGAHGSPASADPDATRSQLAPSPYRSKLEARYAQHLKALEFSGSIAFWHYEPMNFRLPGEKNFYKPDFLIVAGNGITFVDTKGRNKSDERSLVKIKTAAGLHRWAKFMQVRWEKGMWVERTIESR